MATEFVYERPGINTDLVNEEIKLIKELDVVAAALDHGNVCSCCQRELIEDIEIVGGKS